MLLISVPKGVPVRYWVGMWMTAMSCAAGAAELRDVRVWASPDSTRVVFDLDRAAEHSLFTLQNPERVVIDLADTQRAQALAARLEGKGLVQRVRSAMHNGGTLRVVLDLDGPVKSKSFSLQPNESYGFRVVLDLMGQAQAAEPAPPRPTVMTEKPIVIAIDAGHGGEDPGARGRRGLLEKDVSLALARRLAVLVNQEAGLHAVLVRDGDYYIKLRDRIGKAQRVQADLFVSIHANSYRDPKVRGTAVYVLSPKGVRSEHAEMLENRENMADLIGGADHLETKDDTTLAVIADIFQTSAMEASYDAGGRLLEAMGRVNVLQKPRVQQASFVVLKSATFPSVLVETAFLTNDREERLLADPVYQESMARSMLDGIKGYFQTYRPLQQVVQRPAAGAAATGTGLQPVSIQGVTAR
jgi:N-acetylmuramoyl-L-alanine amidase